MLLISLYRLVLSLFSHVKLLFVIANVIMYSTDKSTAGNCNVNKRSATASGPVRTLHSLMLILADTSNAEKKTKKVSF